MSASLDSAIRHLYNFDFDAGRTEIRQCQAAHPSDPVGHAIEASACLFAELNRRDLLQREVLAYDGQLTGASTAGLDGRFNTALAAARRHAKARLACNPDDRDALLALSIATSTQRDHCALLEKRLTESLDYVKQSHGYALRLLEVDSKAHDACAVTGFNEYLVGSLPGFARWFVQVDGLTGDKELGLQLLSKAARYGQYLRPFAQLLLAFAYQRENRPRDSKRVLAGLAREFPDNPVFPRELEKLQAR